MQVQDINISLIKPYKNNAKRHTDTQIANVAESIRQFGWAQPIVVDRQTYRERLERTERQCERLCSRNSKAR